MGSLPRLKIKDEIRYRKGSTNESVNCKACKQFWRGWYQHVNCPNGPDVIEHRCRLVGLKTGARYRIREDNTCDRQEISDAWRAELARLGAGIVHPAPAIVTEMTLRDGR